VVTIFGAVAVETHLVQTFYPVAATGMFKAYPYQQV